MILIAVGEAGTRHLGAFDEQLTRSNYIYELQENSCYKIHVLRSQTPAFWKGPVSFLFTGLTGRYETPAHAVKFGAVPCSN
jgi:hypothetical protein